MPIAPDPAPEPDARVTFEIRPATPADVPSFVELLRQVAGEGRYIRTEKVNQSRRFYRRLFRRSWTPSEATIVAMDGRRVIGQLHVAREDQPATRHVASLRMVVAAEWRGRGVGTALMAEAIRWAREAGVEKLSLSVYPDNDAARALYAKFGFEDEGRLSGHSKKTIGYRDEILMGLWLIPKPDGSGSPGGP